jgi:hypothetical protein
VVIGGLVTSTLTLVVLPILYTRLEERWPASSAALGRWLRVPETRSSTPATEL